MIAYIVDSFTNTAFKGNPAAVCFLKGDISDRDMQQIACEFGLSETAFIRETGVPGKYYIRYFSPRKEIPLCGHATLASAKVIFEQTDIGQIHFVTGEQIDLPVTRNGAEIVMEFHVYKTIPVDVPAAMLSALGITATLRTAYSEKNKIILLEMEDSRSLAALTPDFKALVSSYTGINGVLVTARSGTNEYDYHYRYFWPWAGTNEDPVTGGVQTFLAPYWGEKLGKNKLKAFQSSSRTGYMDLELRDNKVLLKSHAVIILKGDLLAFDNR